LVLSNQDKQTENAVEPKYLKGSGLFVRLAPAVDDQSGDTEWRECQVQDTTVHAFGGLFTQLLCGLGADRALRGCHLPQQQAAEKEGNDEEELLHDGH